MRRFFVAAVLCFVLPDVGLAQQYDFKETHPREWTDSSGQNELTATLTSYDSKVGNVILQYADETTMEIPVLDLSISDRRYLKRQTNKADRAAKRVALANRNAVRKVVDEKAAKSNELTLNTGVSSVVRNVTDDVRRIYDIDWYRVPANAATAAKNAAGVKDDKPIMWFRVLGELSGYM